MKALRLARKVRRLHAIQDQKQLVCDLQAKINLLQGRMHGLDAELSWWQEWYYDYGGDSVSHYIKHEVCNRIKCIAPVLEEKVSAAMDQRQPKITGSKRLRRNVAEHVFNQGLDVSHASDSDLKRAQRGKRTLVQCGKSLVLNDIIAIESAAVAVADPSTEVEDVVGQLVTDVSDAKEDESAMPTDSIDVDDDVVVDSSEVAEPNGEAAPAEVEGEDEDDGADEWDQPSEVLLISSLPADATDETIRTVFQPFGTVVRCHMLPASPQGTACLLQMGLVADALWIYQNLHDSMPVGVTQPISVETCSYRDVLPC